MQTHDLARLEIVDSIASITLDQAGKHNAFDDKVIACLLGHLDTIRKSPQVRVLLLKAEGKHFCAGADLAWMKRMADMNHEENCEDARQLARLMSELNGLPIPSVCRVQGAAYGGAIGLIACCDIAFVSENARFCLSEVKLGLAPATIGPFVMAAIGEKNCRRLFLTAEVFDASQAQQFGLVNEVYPSELLDNAIQGVLASLLKAGPKAQAAAKKLIQDLKHFNGDPSEMTSELIASLRVSAEGQEGLGAFFDKRPPSWLIQS